MLDNIKKDFQREIAEIKEAGLFKSERVITTPQSSKISTTQGSEVLNFCANNYLGLSSHPMMLEAAKKTIDSHGFGMSSVRFICGTQNIHKELEQKISNFVGMEDAILYAAAFDANGGLFEPLLNAEDAIISDQLNHASIIDGIRLCKAKRFRYANNNMEDLEAKLIEAQGSRRIMIATDGVFSMDGIIAQIDKICDLADKYGAMVMVDDSHATGFVGRSGKGSHEHCNALRRVDIIVGTFGKALGGASGGFTAASNEIVELLRQRSRPYLFSNTLAPSVVGASIKALDLISNDTSLIDQLTKNAQIFREGMAAAGFDLVPGDHAIIPVMLYDAKIAQEFATRLLKENIYVIGFFFPVVPKEQARIRVQISAAHTIEEIDLCIKAFTKVGKRLGVI